jgi:hypothetical protein
MKTWQIFLVAATLAFGVAILACDGSSTGDEDVVAEDDAPASSITGDVEDTPDSAGGCSDECGPIGSQQCVDAGNYQVCINDGECLAWGPGMPCIEGQECNTNTGYCGSDDCFDECANAGVKTCTKEGDKVMECQQAQTGCNVLNVMQTCADNQTCSNGECKDGEIRGGDNDCLDIVKCVAGCQNQQCAEGCGTNASQAGIEAYNAMGQCAQTTCAQFTTFAAQQQCIVASCGDSWTGCVGPWGTGTCLAMLQCAGACGPNPNCQFDCLVQGTQAAQNALWATQACMEANCLQQCGQDQTCLENCAGQSCGNEYMACQNG